MRWWEENFWLNAGDGSSVARNQYRFTALNIFKNLLYICLGV